MSPARVVALPDWIAVKVRSTLRSPRYGHPAHAEVATGHGPCRACLRPFEVGVDRRILFTLDAFEGIEPSPLPGPVFIHEEPCERFPEDGGFPHELEEHPLSIFAYGRGRRLLGQELGVDRDAAGAAARLLDLPGVDYVQVHDAAAGCYDFRIERAERREDSAAARASG